METQRFKKENYFENEIKERQNGIDELNCLVSRKAYLRKEIEKINKKIFFIKAKFRIEHNSKANTMNPFFRNQKYDALIEKVLQIVSAHFKLDAELIVHRNRKHMFITPRHVAMYFSRVLYDIPVTYIGEYFDGRDHSTVLNANRNIKNRIETYSDFREEMEDIKIKILAL